MTPERLQELLNAFVDDQLDPQGQRELAKALEDDEEARRAFVRATDQHQALRDLLGKPAAKSRRWTPWAVWGAVAAGAILALSVYLLRPDPSPAKAGPVVVHEPKPAPPPPYPVNPAPEPAPVPIPVPAPVPKPKPDPLPVAPAPDPLPPPKEPQKPPTPVPPAPKPPEPRPEKPPTPPPAPPKETAVAVATIESIRGDVFAVSGKEGKPAVVGQVLNAGQGVATGAAQSGAVVVLLDSTRLELQAGTTISEILAAGGKRIHLDQGFLGADVAKQPAGSPLIFVTRHAEATILGTRLALTCFETTRVEVKEGQVRFTRLEDKRSVNVGSGYSSVAAKGQDLTPRRITRGAMMAGAAIWGEDFQEPEEIDKDWSLQRNGMAVTTAGVLEFDADQSGDASLNLRAPVTPPLRISVDVEFTHRLKNTLVALRFQSWKPGKDLVHIDLDEERYYLRIGDQNVTAEIPRRNPRRERWTVELAADGGVAFLVDGKVLLKSKRLSTNEEYHMTLMTRVGRDPLPGARVRFDNLVLERLK